MVIVSDLPSIFWGVALEGGSKKYTQMTERPFHLSMAALDPSDQNAGGGPVSLMFEQNSKSYVLCTLQRGTLYQQPLNLEFGTGEEVTFYVNGQGKIHLSGYVMPEDEFPPYQGDSDDDDDDSEAEDDSVEDSDDDAVKPGMKRPKLTDSDEKKPKKPKLTIDDLDSEDEDDSDDDDFIDDEAEDVDDEDDDDDDDEDIDEDEEEGSSESESEDEDAAKKKVKKEKAAKQAKVAMTGSTGNGAKSQASKNAAASDKSKEKKQLVASMAAVMASIIDKPAAGVKDKTTVLPTVGSQKQQKLATQTTTQPPQQPAASTEPAKKKKKNKKKKNKENQSNQQPAEASTSQTATNTQQQQVSKTPTKRTLEGGVVVEDLKEGHGPEAKIGKMVRVYYTGRLPNGKIFDSTLSGNGFKFKLGKKEVISGWDIGLNGMKVGGKRKLVIPPRMGYGSQQAGQIPPNSTLIFDVELRAVN
jgi:FK506-binding nuclear protein